MAYTIQAGDTLSGIAQKNNTTVNELLKLNPNITDANKIYAGKTLNLSPTTTPNVTAQTAAPSTTNINTTVSNGLNLPTGSPSTPGTSDVNGMIGYYNTLYQNKIAESKDLQSQLQSAKSQQTTQTQSWLDKITGSKSADQVRSEATTATGINPTTYFAEEQAAISELSTLNEEYNATVAARDQQIADVTGKPGQSLDFMNNQIAQINRNASVKLNQMSANINSKAALFEAKQGAFSEAQTYINNAVTAATSDLKYNVDMYNLFYEKNQNTIDSLGTEYKTALKEAQSAATNAWTLAVDEKSSVGTLMIENPQAGITINDSLATAQQKVSASGGTASYQLQLAQERRLSNNNSNQPSDESNATNWTDLQIKSAINGIIKSSPDATYEEVLQEINSDPTIANKDRAIQIAKNKFGIKEPNQPLSNALNLPKPYTTGGTKLYPKSYPSPFEQTSSSFFTNLFS